MMMRTMWACVLAVMVLGGAACGAAAEDGRLAGVEERVTRLEERVSALETPPDTPPEAPPEEAPAEASPPAVDGAARVETGWTVFTPHENTRIIYVSAEGDDRNDGRSPETAVRTPERGYALIRHKFPDWLLFRRGDVFDLDPKREGDFREWRKSGFSVDERIVVGAYGDESEARPILRSNGRGVLSANAGQLVKHVVFAHLHFYANRRDPGSPDFDGGAGYEYGIRWHLSGGEDILFEGLLVEYFANNITIGAPPKRTDGPRGVTLRRCVVRNAYSHVKAGHSQGAGFGNTTGLTIDSCIFNRNGYEPRVKESKRTGFNHGVYLYHTKDTRIVNCSFSRNSYGGIKARGDREGDVANLVIEGNLFSDELVGAYLGGDKTSGDPEALVIHGAEIRGNVFTRIGGDLGGTKMGVALGVSQVKDGSIVENLFVHKTMNTNWPALEIDGDRPRENILVKRNVVHEWPRPYSKDELWVRKVGEGVRLEGNRAFQAGGTYVDGTRTLDGYVAGLGMPDVEAFHAAGVEQRLGGWREELEAGAVLSHMRAGYEAAR